ncbi:hypothetical protein [Oenococcus oeni]|nr:hypothetical protein [Oenococcus oeni]SYW16218.1 hypothetical protein OENI_30050 [Oenococcus oeni]
MKLIAFIIAVTLLAVVFNLHRKTKISNSKISKLNNDVDYKIPQV